MGVHVYASKASAEPTSCSASAKASEASALLLLLRLLLLLGSRLAKAREERHCQDLRADVHRIGSSHQGESTQDA
jgi:hypothetical protein